MSGLILDVIAKKHRQLFELYLNILSSKRSRNKGETDKWNR